MGRDEVAVVHLTKYFLRQWEKSFGVAPSLDDVNRILEDGCRIRKQMRLYRREGSFLEPVKVLALYWNHASGLIITVDEDLGRAVTVFSACATRLNMSPPGNHEAITIAHSR